MYDKALALQCAMASKLAYAESSRDPGHVFLACDETEAVITRSAGRLFIAFRGTTSLRDWITDANVKKITFNGHRVHEGFYRAYQKIRRHVLGHVNDLAGQADIVITGHSLGAALATVAAFDLDRLGFDVSAVYTFGSPRVGDRKFAAAYNAVFEGRSYRLINDSDLVCRVPTMLRWRHVDQPVWFDGSGQGGQVIAPPWWYGFGEIWQNITRFKWGDSIKDHSIDDYIALLE